MKDVKKLLRAQAADVLPDDARVADNIRRELGYAQEHETYGARTAVAARKTRAPWIAAAAAALAACLLAVILLVTLLPAGNGALNQFTQISTPDDFYAYGAASVGALLSDGQAGTSGTASAGEAGAGVSAAARGLFAGALSAAERAEGAFTSSQRGRDDDDDDNDDDDDDDAAGVSEGGLSAQQRAVVEEYLALAEGLLGDGAIEHSVAAADEGSGYDFAMTVTANALGGAVRYTLYYNERLTGTETDGGEREQNYAIEGLLVLEGGQSYPVAGGKENEEEEGETENELWFRAQTGENSYIRVEQESERETEDGETATEQKYVYTIVKDGRMTERTAVEYESEEGELELKMTVERDPEGGPKETDILEFEREEERGKTVLRVTAQMGGERVDFRVYIENGSHRYVFGEDRP